MFTWQILSLKYIHPLINLCVSTAISFIPERICRALGTNTTFAASCSTNFLKEKYMFWRKMNTSAVFIYNCTAGSVEIERSPSNHPAQPYVRRWIFCPWLCVHMMLMHSGISKAIENTRKRRAMHASRRSAVLVQLSTQSREVVSSRRSSFIPNYVYVKIL